MRWKSVMYLVACVLGAILTIHNMRHLNDTPQDWLLRYSSLAWGLLTLINFVNLIASFRNGAGKASEG